MTQYKKETNYVWCVWMPRKNDTDLTDSHMKKKTTTWIPVKKFEIYHQIDHWSTEILVKYLLSFKFDS